MPEKVVIPGLPNVDVQHGYRAMDFLLESQEDVERGVFHAVADLFHLEVDLLFFDTTSTYFEMDEWDEEEEDLKALGHSKDSRPDLPQIVIGLAVTRERDSDSLLGLARQHLRYVGYSRSQAGSSGLEVGTGGERD